MSSFKGSRRLLRPPPSVAATTLRPREILAGVSDEALDEVAGLAATVCQAPIALVHLIEEERLVCRAQRGLDAHAVPGWTSLASFPVVSRDLAIVPDLAADPRFVGEAALRQGARAYFGAAIRANGRTLGTLSVADTVPRSLDELQRWALVALRNQVQAQLELRRSNLKLARQEEVIRRQNEELQRAQRLREDLSAMLVHDLKNPLAAILPYAELLTMPETGPEEVVELAGEIQAAGQRLNSMILNLLDISRGEDGALVPALLPIAVRPFVEEVARTVGRRPSARRHVLDRVLYAGLGEIQADPDLLRRVLENLCDNAFKYTPPGGVVRIEAVPEGRDAVELRVCDSGMGIPVEDRERVFDKYARIAAPGQPVSQGSRGLGLTFCKLAVEAHGGRIGVRENAPRGAVFWLRLPRFPHK